MRLRRWFDKKILARAQQRWFELASRGDMSLHGRQRLRDEAMSLRRNLDRFLTNTDRHVDQIKARLDVMHLPGGTDWRWRPSFMDLPLRPDGVVFPTSGAQFGLETSLWHDCPERSLILQQIKNLRTSDLSPFGLMLEVFGFSGSFLSVSIDLPSEALANLTRNHIIRLEANFELEREMTIFARLNVANGPNTDQVTHQFTANPQDTHTHHVIEFDLAYTEINEKRLEKIWLDLIFEAPNMNALEIRELFLSRHLRAEF